MPRQLLLGGLLLGLLLILLALPAVVEAELVKRIFVKLYKSEVEAGVRHRTHVLCEVLLHERD